ncbi:MAG: hypothetical protein AB1757_02675 [Acidobacteriota bacterium]
MQELTEAILHAPVDGLNLRGKTFGEQFGEGATLLVFLRHFG